MEENKPTSQPSQPVDEKSRSVKVLVMAAVFVAGLFFLSKALSKLGDEKSTDLNSMSYESYEAGTNSPVLLGLEIPNSSSNIEYFFSKDFSDVMIKFSADSVALSNFMSSLNVHPTNPTEFNITNIRDKDPAWWASAVLLSTNKTGRYYILSRSITNDDVGYTYSFNFAFDYEVNTAYGRGSLVIR